MNITVSVPTSCDSSVSISIDIPISLPIEELIDGTINIKCNECLSDSFESYVDVPIRRNGCIVEDNNYFVCADFIGVLHDIDLCYISFTR